MHWLFFYDCILHCLLVYHIITVSAVLYCFLIAEYRWKLTHCRFFGKMLIFPSTYSVFSCCIDHRETQKFYLYISKLQLKTMKFVYYIFPTLIFLLCLYICNWWWRFAPKRLVLFLKNKCFALYFGLYNTKNQLYWKLRYLECDTQWICFVSSVFSPKNICFLVTVFGWLIERESMIIFVLPGELANLNKWHFVGSITVDWHNSN